MPSVQLVRNLAVTGVMPVSSGGTWTSPIIDLHGDVQRCFLDWSADIFADTSVIAAVRFSANGTTWEGWQYAAKRQDLTGIKRYAQISFTLETSDPGKSPVLYQVALYAMRFAKWGMAQYGPVA